MRQSAARRVALTGMLFALAVTLGFFESLLTPVLGLPPGVKLGLANVVVMYALLFLSGKQAVLLVLLKAGFALITRGGTAGILSFTGGMVSFVLMALLLAWDREASLVVVSLVGSLGHNLGQFVAVRLLLGPAMVYYLPILLISGVVMGFVTALTLKALLPPLARLGLGRLHLPRDEAEPDDSLEG